MEQVCARVETQNKFCTLLDIEPAQREVQYTCCNELRPNLGKLLVNSRVVDSNSHTRNQRGVTQLGIECPSMESAIASIISACDTREIIPDAEKENVEESVKEIGEREKKVGITGTNWDRLRESLGVFVGCE